MHTEKKLAELVNKLFLNTGSVFSGIFIKDTSVISKTIYTEKKAQLEEILKLIISKAHQINEFLPDFGEEYVYAEGNDISIFIYFARPDIAICSIIEQKPKFALLKLEHTSIAEKLKKMEREIDAYIKGEPLPVEETEEEIEEETTDESTQQTSFPEDTQKKEDSKSSETETGDTDYLETEGDKFAEELEILERTENLEDLEEVLSGSIDEENENPPLEEILKTDHTETIPLEEIIEAVETGEEKEEEHGEKTEETKEEETLIEENFEVFSEEMEFYDPDVLTKIQQELLKEIGPVGKFLFKKRVKELNIDPEKITRNILAKLINKLSDDIIDEKRKKRFLEKVSAFL